MVGVFADLATRWQSNEMVKALQLEQNYTPAELADLFARRGEPRRDDPSEEKRRRQEVRARVILLRVPNYFEDALEIARVGGLDRDRFNYYMSGVAIREWDLWEPAVRALQKLDGDLTYELFEVYARQMIVEDAARRKSSRVSEAPEAADPS